jgi:ATP-binding protein involved in chromosome partitioning
MHRVTTPTKLRQASLFELAACWSDGHESLYPVRSLRFACKCAGCVHEFTRAPILDPASVPLDVRPMQVESVGRYGIRIAWSDGHDTGIMTFRDLRALCPCEDCGVDVERGGGREECAVPDRGHDRLLG